MCASAHTDVVAANGNAPAAAADKVGFYGGQSTSFGALAESAKDGALRGDLVAVQLDLGLLQADWFGVSAGAGGNAPADIGSATATLIKHEGALGSWCLAHTGAW